MLTRTDLPAGYRNSLTPWYPSTHTTFAQDRVVNSYLSRKAPSTFRRIAKEN